MADLRVDITLTLEEAADGCQRSIDVTYQDPCTRCGGSGLVGNVVDCATCKGQGHVQQAQGFFLIDLQCPTCRGAGKLGDSCRACGSKGWTPRTTPVLVTVPAGVDDEQTLRLSGKGEDGGHLWVVMTVVPHERFRRIGDDLVVDVAIAKELARSGGRVTVRLLRGEREVTVPPNTQTGDETVVRGCGIQKVGAPPTPMPAATEDAPYRELDTSGRGNLIVKWRIEEPRSWVRRLFR